MPFPTSPGVRIVHSTIPPTPAPNIIWDDTNTPSGSGVSDGTDHDHDLLYEYRGSVARHERRDKAIHGIRDFIDLVTYRSQGVNVRNRSESFSRYNRGTATLTNGVLHLTWLRWPKDISATKFVIESGATAVSFAAATWSSGTAYVTGNVVAQSGSNWIALASSTNVTPGTDGTKWAAYPALLKCGLYSIDATAGAVLQASTADVHASVLTTPNAKYEPAMAVGMTPRGGYRYAVGVLGTGMTTAATVRANDVGASGTMDPVLSNQLAGQTDLPTTIDPTTLSASTFAIWTGWEK